MNLLHHDITDIEAPFESHELFFSITDRNGTILSGNDVFVRISGYTSSELIGEPHNIIRHPDMPRIVFKTLWDAILSGRPLVAYVKNRTKTGGYYWVLAAVFPVGDKFISIRVKPSTALFETAKTLYFRLLMAETSGGMEHSADLLNTQLSELGYKNYNDFMSDALLQELRVRNRTIGRPPSPVLPLHLQHPYTLCTRLMEKYDHWFGKIDFFVHTSTSFAEQREAMRLQARNIVFLSLNASVSSYKVENGGETFGVLSHSIRTTAKENDLLFSQIQTVIITLSEKLNQVVFAVSSIRLQLETILYFFREIAASNCDRTIASQNVSELITLALITAQELKTLQEAMNALIEESLERLEELEQQMMYLGYVQIYGLIESARNVDESTRFGVIFSQLKELISQMSEGISAMQKMGREFSSENRSLQIRSEQTLTLAHDLYNVIHTIKNPEG